MKSVGTKLTFWIVVFPISLIVVLSAGVIYLYPQSLEASVIVDIMATLSSVMLVDLLVWERLRDSLSKKLNYLHDNYLSELYDSFKRGSIISFYKPSVKKKAPDIKRYGRFMGISLYPKDLMGMIGSFLTVYEEFSNRFAGLENIGKEHCKEQFRLYWWCHVLGIEHLDDATLKVNLDRPEFKLHENKARLVEKKHSKLIEEIKGYSKEAKRIRKKILERLEDFFKSNNLEFEQQIW